MSSLGSPTPISVRSTTSVKRNDEELRSEGQRLPPTPTYAVMVAVVFLPDDACDDATTRHASSLGAWVKYLRPLAQRQTAHDDIDRDGRIFIALFARVINRAVRGEVPPSRGKTPAR